LAHPLRNTISIRIVNLALTFSGLNRYGGESADRAVSRVKRMKTARIVVLVIAIGAGGIAAYLASGSDTKTTVVATTTDSKLITVYRGVSGGTEVLNCDLA
jgi:hypothetical protein